MAASSLTALLRYRPHHQERRPVIRHTQDSRCHVNIPTTLQHTAPVLHCAGSLRESLGNIWFSVLEGTLQVWHALCVWSVSVWTRRPTPVPASLRPPGERHLSDYSGCTMHFGSPPFYWP